MIYYFNGGEEGEYNYNYGPNELAELAYRNKELYEKIISQNIQKGNITEEDMW